MKVCFLANPNDIKPKEKPHLYSAVYLSCRECAKHGRMVGVGAASIRNNQN